MMLAEEWQSGTRAEERVRNGGKVEDKAEGVGEGGAGVELCKEPMCVSLKCRDAGARRFLFSCLGS